MSADPSPAPSSPFLAFVSPEDRSPMRVGLWLCLALPLAAIAPALLATAMATFDKSLVDTPPASGPFHLLAIAREQGANALLYLAEMLPVLGAARVAFERPSWTFAAPGRPFSPGLFGWGAATGGVLAFMIIAIDALQGHPLKPPLLDASQPLQDRFVYALSLIPIMLLARTSRELLFRGVVLQVSGAFLKTRIGLCIVNGLVAGLGRGLFMQDPDPLDFVQAALIGGAFAYAVLELGGLEFSIGATFTAAFLELMLETPDFGSHKFQWSDLTKLDAWVDLGASIGIALLVIAAASWVKKRRDA
jgi:membrane protease YdiL (CAAX protease family)